MSGRERDPFTGPPPKEVPLSSAPLERVICQVRFPEILAIEQREFTAAFQEAIREQYPVLRQERGVTLALGPLGAMPVQPTPPIWRFSDGSGAWRVSLARDFVALETTRYESRTDFLARLESALAAVGKHVRPSFVDRLGIRYVDRVRCPNLEDIRKLLRPEILGPLAADVGRRAAVSVGQTVFDVPEASAQLLLRWARMPAKETIDPAALEPIDEPSWTLDFDMYRAEQRPFDVAILVKEARAYAERIYSVFRWAVNDEFLKRFGGKP